MRELFRRLVETPGASGFEEAVIELVAVELRKSVPEVTVDGLGNVVGMIPGSGKRSVLVCVHTDEVSLLVKYIDPKGYLYRSHHECCIAPVIMRLSAGGCRLLRAAP